VLPERSDRERLVPLVRSDLAFVDALLGHDRVCERLIGDDEVILRVTPQLFFSVLLRRVRQDLEAAAYTLERRQGQRLAVFDTQQAAGLLADRLLRDYLAGMLASFTRVQGVTRRVRVRRGVWRKLRFNDLDVDSLIRYSSDVEEEHRFEVYRRIADVCLFLAGMFPEYIESQRRYPLSGALRPARGGFRRSLEDYEREGRTFYSLAAGHQGARASQLSAPLTALAQSFELARKPLSHLSDHYLRLRKHTLFEL
jgi:HEPN domain-containing protein